MILLFLRTYKAVFVRRTKQLSSQSWPIESREALVNFGYTKLCVAVGERSPIGRCPSFDGDSKLQSGNKAFGPLCIILDVVRIFSSTLLRQCFDAPLSPIKEEE